MLSPRRGESNNDFQIYYGTYYPCSYENVTENEVTVPSGSCEGTK